MNTDDTTLTTTTEVVPKKYKWTGNRKQRLFIKNWVEPSSETFGNAYKSAIAAGFSHTYSSKITAAKTSWLSEAVSRLDLEPEHIKQGIQSLAISSPQSKSPDDTRLKAYELLAKISGMIDNKNGSTTVNIVQPILGGQSINYRKPSETGTKQAETVQTDVIEGELVD